jgi:hypothetical protein
MNTRFSWIFKAAGLIKKHSIKAEMFTFQIQFSASNEEEVFISSLQPTHSISKS